MQETTEAVEDLTPSAELAAVDRLLEEQVRLGLPVDAALTVARRYGDVDNNAMSGSFDALAARQERASVLAYAARGICLAGSAEPYTDTLEAMRRWFLLTTASPTSSLAAQQRSSVGLSWVFAALGDTPRALYFAGESDRLEAFADDPGERQQLVALLNPPQPAPRRSSRR